MRMQAQIRENVLRIANLLAQKNSGSSRGQIIKTLGFAESNSTVYRWIEAGIDSGLIVREGHTNNAVYYASREHRSAYVREQLARPLSRRERVGYNESFLESYEPNKTFYLTQEQRTALGIRCRPGSVPLETQALPDIKRFLCEISYASSKLEGNQHSLAATQALLMDGRIEKEIPEEDRIMIYNHRDAVNFLINGIHTPPRPHDVRVCAMDISSIHTLLASDLLDDNFYGKLRVNHVDIGQSAYIPSDIPVVISRCYHLLLDKAKDIQDPFEQSFFLAIHLPYLQPFEDCNKRTARIACNIPLLKAGCAPMSWIETDRDEYVQGLFAVYEHNEVGIMADVYTAAYMRSTERLRLIRAARQPSSILVSHRQELREAIRVLLKEGREVIPPGLSDSEEEDFKKYVSNEISGLEKNPASGIRFGVSIQDVQNYFDSIDGDQLRPRER